MPYDTLPEFLTALESAGELRRIKTSVDPVLEVAEIADRVSKAPDRDGNYAGSQAAPFGGASPKHGTGAVNQALLFENVKGSSVPLAINTFGSYKRMNMALGSESFDELADKIGELARPEMPSGI